VTFKGVGGSAGNGVYVRLYPTGPDADSSACDTASAFGNGIGARDPLLYGSATTWKSEPEDPCNTSKEIVATLETSVGGDEIARKPIEIAVYEEPPLQDRTGNSLAPAPTEPTWTPLTAGAPTKVVPGTSIANAPVVADGTYSGDLNPGESQVFAVPLDWGQNLQAQLDAKLTRDIIGAGGVGSDIEVNIIGPLRDSSDVSFYGSEPDDWTTEALANIQGTPRFRTGAQTQTIGYLNRGSSSSDVRGAAVAGLRYVQVTFNTIGDAVNLPYTLTLKTNGTAGENAPTYAKVDGLKTPEADSRLVDLKTTSDAAASPGTAKASGRTADNSTGTNVPFLSIGLGVLGVVALVGAGLLLRRSSRSTG
jgi:Ca-activated chloride channel family protein